MKVYFAIGVSERRRVAELQSCKVQKVLFSFGETFMDVEKVQRMEKFDDILIDSGAFGHGNSELKLESRRITSINGYFHAYREFLKAIPGIYPRLGIKLSGYFNFDDMGSAEKSWENYRIMKEDGLKPIPVYHHGEEEDVLARYCEDAPYVGLGGLAVGRINTEELKKWWGRIAVRYPRTRFHLLGTNQFLAFTEHQPFSIDSTSWLGDIWGNLITLDKHGLPEQNGFEMKRSDGRRHFFTAEEMRYHNIRAMLYLEKMDWSKAFKDAVDKGLQGSMMSLLDRDDGE